MIIQSYVQEPSTYPNQTSLTGKQTLSKHSKNKY